MPRLTLQRTNVVSVDAWLRLFAVDLLFVFVVVLICYMVITPILPHVPMLMDLPLSSTAVKSPEMEGDIMVSVLDDGQTLVLGQRVDLAEHLRARLTAVEGEVPVVRVRVDRAAPFGAVRRVVVVAQQAGYRRVTFMMHAPFTKASIVPTTTISSVDESNPLIMDFSPDVRAAACAAALALVFFAAAVLWTVLRRSQSSRPGCVVWILLLLTLLCLRAAWEAYYPSCPRGWYC